MTTPAPKPRSFHPTPSWLIFGLLVVECLLFLSDRFQWPTWHKGYAVLTAVASVGVVFLAMLLWLIVALVFHWRFQFSIKSLLILVVVVALPFSWLAVEMRAAREQKAAVEEIEKVGSVVYDWNVDASSNPIPNAKPSEPAWLRNLLGDDFFTLVISAGFHSGEQITDAALADLAGLTHLQMLRLGGTRVTDAALAQIARLTQLQTLWLDDTRITDDGLAHLAGLTRLQRLVLRNTPITDAGLAHLAGLTQLQHLWIDNTQITDAGLAHLAGLTRLQRLYLGNTRITDDGLAHLAGLTRLQRLDLSSTQITDAGLPHLAALDQLKDLSLHDTKVTGEGVNKLKQALPNCGSFH